MIIASSRGERQGMCLIQIRRHIRTTPSPQCQLYQERVSRATHRQSRLRHNLHAHLKKKTLTQVHVASQHPDSPLRVSWDENRSRLCVGGLLRV
jgi:hypothetical protein